MNKVTMAKFTTKARTLNLLGRDNILDFNSAIIELIKNSYDAFSPRVDVLINNNEINIIDSGEGMNLETILEVFFSLGTDNKLKNEVKNQNNQTRIMNGSMGIGRLSLGRLGRNCTIITSNGINAYQFSIDWELFNNDSELSDLEIPIAEINHFIFLEEYNKRKIQNLNGTGTIIIVNNLNDRWLKDDYEKEKTNYSMLVNNLEKVCNPVKNLNDFDIYLNYYGKNRKIESFLEDYNYDAKIDFTYSHQDKTLLIQGKFDEIDVNLLPPDFVNEYYDRLKQYLRTNNKKNANYLFKKEINVVEELDEQISEVSIGEFEGTFYFVKKQSASKIPFIRGAIEKNLRDMIERGISLYRDGFKVRPYGEENTMGFDWLEIDKRRSSNPAGVNRYKHYLMQANQLSGYVNITREFNDKFEDQANREGLKNSPEFEKLKQILMLIIQEFSNIRSEIHFLYKEFLNKKSDVKYHSEKGKNKSRTINRLLEKNNGEKEQLFSDPDFLGLVNPETIFELFSLGDEAYKENINLITESDMLRALATQGITMAMFAHQIRNEKSFFAAEGDALRRMSDYYEKNYQINMNKQKTQFNLNKFSEIIDNKNQHIVSFITSALRVSRRGKVDYINIVNYLKDTFEWWSNSLKDNYHSYDFRINNNCYNDLSEESNFFYVKASIQHLDSVFMNLLSNSYKNFEDGKIKDRKIQILIQNSDNNHLLITYSDNGTGLSKNIKDKEKIFEAYQSYANGRESTGLGLWILSNTIDSMKGKKKLLSNVGEQGFHMQMILMGGIKK